MRINWTFALINVCWQLNLLGNVHKLRCKQIDWTYTSSMRIGKKSCAFVYRDIWNVLAKVIHQKGVQYYYLLNCLWRLLIAASLTATNYVVFLFYIWGQFIRKWCFVLFYLPHCTKTVLCSQMSYAIFQFCTQV